MPSGIRKSIVALTALLLLMATGASAQQVRTTLDGRTLHFDQPPVMQDGRVLVPLRGIFENLGADVVYDAANRTIKATRGSRVVELTLGSQVARVDGRTLYLDVPAMSVSGRTVVPLRFVSESLGADVTWNAATKTVAIMSPADGVAVGDDDVTPPVASRPEIDTIIHTAYGNVNRVGQVIEVTATGTPGGNASFEIPGVTNRIAMSELRSGVYQGQLAVSSGMRVEDGRLVVHLSRNGRETIREADRAVSIRLDQGGTTGEFELVSVTPQPNAIIGESRPTIHLRFDNSLRAGTVRLTLDGRDVTNQTQIYSNSVTYTPTSNLAFGMHHATISAVDSQGNLVNEQWSFRVDRGVAGGGDPVLFLTNLANGASVPEVFNIQGRTEPYATVRIEAASTRALIPGLIGIADRVLTASGQANASGWFDIQLDASSVPDDSQLDITVTSFSPTTSQTNSVELDVTRR
ncbi:MAG: hypothetical protein HY319_04080 [Armatimonadetes bacterium]|nr:hypothetical protein [Armatimonadota bacterium]